jgi:NAD(P)H-dependent nitrite reductase large subunit/NAD(P)H-dependent nitrite reductase small subunit
MSARKDWRFVCAFDDIMPETGVCALLDDKQIAVFRVGEVVYALDNHDPASNANVLSRGLIGDVGGEIVVASPVYKHHFSLITGRCLEDADMSVKAYPARIIDGQVWVQPEPVRMRAHTKRKLVVIGNGMAGMRTVEELLNLTSTTYDITVFGAEPHGNYNRILLSPVLSGEKKIEDIMLHTLEWYAEHGVALHAGDPAVSIDRRRRIVTSKSGIEASYDRLLIATGSNPIVLPVPGKDLPGVVTFRDLQDVDAMLQASKLYKKAAVIGGGLLGLEAANGLRRQGMDVTVVHLLDTLMERQLDKSAAALLKASLEERGLKFKMPAKTVEILSSSPVSGLRSAARSDSRVAGLRFDDGTEIEADLVIMAAGIRPNIDIAKLAWLRCERGILVDDTMQTFDPSIYAVGECVQHRNSTYGLVAPLWEQARVCATHLAEIGVSRYRGSMLSTQLKVTGIDLFSAGDFVDSADSEALVLRDAKLGIYKRLVIRDNKVRGAVLYGDTKDGPWYFELMTEGRDIGKLRETILFGEAFSSP